MKIPILSMLFTGACLYYSIRYRHDVDNGLIKTWYIKQD